MPRAQVAPVRELRRPAEVRGLVPAVAGRADPLDDALEVRLHRLGLARELVAVRVREAGARLRLELVAGEVLRLELERRAQVGVEVGGALARDPVDQVERDVVEAGRAQSGDRAAHVVRAGLAVEHLEQAGLEALRAEGDARHAGLAQERGERGRDGLRVRLDGHLGRGRQGSQQARELRGLGERRRAAAEEDALQPRRKHLALERELGEQRVDVRAVLPAPPDDRDEVAVAAPRRAERQVHVQMPGARAHFFPASRFSTARNASCGTSTDPTCFMRRFPAFWRSSSFRLRVMSPP